MACSHADPNTRDFPSAFFTSRDSDARIASAEAGLSDADDKYWGGRPVTAAACFANSRNTFTKFINSAALNCIAFASGSSNARILAR